MSEQKKQNHSIRQPTNIHPKSASSSSSALSHGDDGSEHCSESSRSKNWSSSKPSRRSCGNADNIKKIVQEEGRIARNLVTWNVPLENSDKTNKSASFKPSGPCSPIKKLISSQPQSPTARSIGQRGKDADQSKASSRKCSDSAKNVGHPARKRQTNASSKKDIRARYWAYLFENLDRAVDEIYQTCESDESVVECKEVIMMLDQYRRDFHSLIERLLMMQDYEKTGEECRRKNLAWEVRKRSPSKSLMASYRKEAFSPTGKAVRSLIFTDSNDSAVDVGASSGGSTDLVPKAASSERGFGNDVDGKGGRDDAKSSSSISRLSSASYHPERCAVLDVPLCSLSSTWADRVRNPTNHKLQTSTTDKNLNGSKPRNKENPDVNHAVKKPRTSPNNLKISSASLSGTNNETLSTPLGCVLSNSLANIPSPSGHDADQDGWEVVYRGGRQRQKTPVRFSANSSLNGGHQYSLSSKSLHLLPSSSNSDSAPYLKNEIQLSSSSPFLFPQRPTSDPERQWVILGLPSGPRHAAEDGPLCIDTSFFGREQSVGSFQHPNDRILTTVDTMKVAEPNSETIFANCYGDPRLATYQEGRLGLKDGHEYDDEELNKALMNVFKEDNLENLLEEESEAALESVMQREMTYLQEIEREERGEGEDAQSEIQDASTEDIQWDQDCIAKQLEGDDTNKKEATWGDMMEEAEARTPGRLVHVFEKLSSPSRKRSTAESRKQLDEKQAKAAELRERTLQERGENLRMLRKKVEEIQSLKNELMHQARLRMEKKLQRAEEKRQILLRMKVRKAHEEDTKASEIAFINTLEAQNKRHEIMSKHQESEARLQDMQEERHRRHEEKAAKEAAAEERRKALEADRLSRLQEMQDRRRQRETEFEQRQQEKEKERVEAARARDREREERLAALNKQQQAHIEELQKKIQQKQDETDRRHKEKLEAIQEKAFRMSLQHHSNDDQNDAPPKMAPYEKKKFCSVCNILIPSEVYLLSHLRGKTHQQAIRDSSQGTQPSQQDIEKFNLQHISDAPVDRPDPRVAREKERHRAFRKRCKKLKLRMVQRSTEYEAAAANRTQSLTSQHKSKLQKLIKDLQKCITTPCSGPWAQARVSGLDRNLGEMCRIFEKNVPADKITFKSLGGVTVLLQLFEAVGRPAVDLPPLVPNKSLLLLSSVLKLLCLGCSEVCQYLLLSSKICTLVDLLSQHLNASIPDDFPAQQTGPQCKLVCDQFVCSLVELLAAILLPFAGDSKTKRPSNKTQENKNDSRGVCSSQAFDVVSYVVSIGILDKISVYFNNIRGSIDGDAAGAELLQNCLILVTSLVGIPSTEDSLVLDSKKLDDPTQLILTLKVTQLVGIVSLMYGILLHSDAPARGDNPPPTLPKHTLDVAFLGFRMLNHVACLDLSTFQSSLGEEGMSLEFRHIASYLLWYCNCCSNDVLLHEVILCVGYFSLLNADNQLIIQSGQSPTILQQLCSLPFHYFSDPRLTGILFPTLICCCFKMLSNKRILEQELSCILLSNFVEENVLKDQQSQQGNEDNFSLSFPSSINRFKQFQGSLINHRMCLAARFPRYLWQEAQSYFSTIE